MRILIVLGHFLPGYKSGGPLKSIVNLIGHLGKEFSFFVLTSDRDLGDKEPYPNIVGDQWIHAHGVQLRYGSPQAMSFRALVAAVKETPCDIIYLNSFFSTTTIKLLAARRLEMLPECKMILAPRGEFSQGALALKSVKKRTYIYAGRIAGLFKNIIWQASTKYEVADIKAVLGDIAQKIVVAKDLSAPLPVEPPAHSVRKPEKPLRIVFLSRISPMKNLDYALKVLAGVTCQVDFTVYGPEEDLGYATNCRTLAEALPPGVRVHWRGALAPEAVPAALAAHDLFFLPTRGENFGHVIAEALGAGTPVLLSDTTPWRNLVQHGIGYDLPLAEMDRFRHALEKQAALTASEALEQRRKVFRFAHSLQENNTDIQKNRDLFLRALVD